ncbi:hypothetical protein B0T21DRAFT_411810 [Apiosordaria backusii]|uniref:Uncharacterized protein n=1 Tax=Apiosordaria backusii TaxID=314023 RepID=A0AA40EFN9_9PEZI|nr:hypothetical protein B0T21DRAFT_411810 [Apiosordaria backusii]
MPPSPSFGHQFGVIEPDTSRLLPPPRPEFRRVEHHVRVQGKLVLVKSISTADLPNTTPLSAGLVSLKPTTPGGYESALGCHLNTAQSGRRRRSMDDSDGAIRDRQWRGYGIGGAGNIRRPTDVVQFPSTPTEKRWNLREILGLPSEPKSTKRQI